MKTSTGLTIEEINRFHEHTMISQMGIVFTRIEPGFVEAKMKVSEKVCQPLKRLHGGASLALAETVAGCGSWFLEQGKKFPWGIQVTGTHVSSVPLGESVRAEARLIHKGRTTHLWDVNLFAESTGKAVSLVRVTNKLMEPEPGAP